MSAAVENSINRSLRRIIEEQQKLAQEMLLIATAQSKLAIKTKLIHHFDEIEQSLKGSIYQVDRIYIGIIGGDERSTESKLVVSTVCYMPAELESLESSQIIEQAAQFWSECTKSFKLHFRRMILSTDVMVVGDKTQIYLDLIIKN